MKKPLKIFIIASTILAQANTAIHSVIISGANSYWNYRHQANACHAYKVLINGGIPASNIILLSYNDAVTAEFNPFPGKLFNKASPSAPGADVYEGCAIDYKGKDLTPDVYLAILKQDATAVKGIGTGRVMSSGADDDVFLVFSDHGEPGLVLIIDSFLFANDLLSALKFMHSNNFYNRLVYYMEACDSGSMFQSLPTNLNIYAMTAAQPGESSWANYCPPDAEIEGKNMLTCLGDYFTGSWLDNADSANRTQTTLSQQYKIVKKLTTKSHAMQYGDTSFLDSPISDFMGISNNTVASSVGNGWQSGSDSRDVKLNFLIARHAQEQSLESMEDLSREIFQRKLWDDLFEKIWPLRRGLENALIDSEEGWKCYKGILEFFVGKCGKFSDYGRKYVRSFYEVCGGRREVVGEVKRIVLEECSSLMFFK